jgi:arylsulfatase A
MTKTPHLLLLSLLFFSISTKDVYGETRKSPNVIFILSDDLAQGDVGAYGQKLIQTPRIDQLAAEGTRFLQAYCGTSVCAPSRASLLTGLHSGHCPIRANRELKPEGQMPLPEETTTVAQLLKKEGYATACTGKWGMGMFDTTGSPLKKGFDHFFGYNCQRHAHSYFPKYLYENDQRIELDGKTYAQNLIQQDTLNWIRQQASRPFFLFYAITLPHAKNEIDHLGRYADMPWTEPQKTYAAMVSRLDSDVGALLDLLKELKIEKDTLVLFSGDNGSSYAPESPLGKLFNQSANGLRGYKRSLYEGALRQAAFAWWPGSVPAGRVAEDAWAFWDFLPTVAELAGIEAARLPATDGRSLLSFLKGGSAPRREHFYWELHEGRPQQAVRFGDWKAVRTAPGKTLELYDLATDRAERNNIAANHPDLLQKAEHLMESSHSTNPVWPLVGRGPQNDGHGVAAKGVPSSSPSDSPNQPRP